MSGCIAHCLPLPCTGVQVIMKVIALGLVFNGSRSYLRRIAPYCKHDVKALLVLPNMAYPFPTIA
eukprot:929037-Pelagomonas_calceolata.AAC.1